MNGIDAAKLAAVIQIVATLGAVFALFCRVAKMSIETPPEVRHQHAVLLGGLVFSLVLPGELGRASMAAGVALFLAYSTHRWRFGPPAEIASRPGEFDPAPHHWTSERDAA